MVDWSVFVAPFVTSLLTGVGVYVAMTQRIAVLETKMDLLAAKVERHNNIVERTYKLESDAKTQWNRVDELKERVHELEDLR